MARESTTLTNRHARQQETHSEQRHRRIAEAAYFMAERRGFQGGSALEDWLAAEVQIDGLGAVMGTKSHGSRRASH